MNFIAGGLIGWIAINWKMVAILAVGWGLAHTAFFVFEVGMWKRLNSKNIIANSIDQGFFMRGILFCFCESLLITLAVGSCVRFAAGLIQ